MANKLWEFIEYAYLVVLRLIERQYTVHWEARGVVLGGGVRTSGWQHYHHLTI
jgi:hypothetical protein